MQSNKKWLLALGLVAGVGLFAFFLRVWFTPAPVKIYHRVVSARPQWAGRQLRNSSTPAAPVVTFGFDRKLLLTDVKVFVLPDLETNKHAHPIWHLVSETNSMPVKGFSYGERIRGMKPFVKGSRPVPLTPEGTYRLFIEAGSIEGQHDFGLVETPTSKARN